MSIVTDLQREIRLVIDNLERRPWVQGKYHYGEAVCSHGAVTTCQGLKPGDESIIRAVMRAKGLTEDWNDEDGRTKVEVLRKFAEVAGVSDSDLELTFGPNWRQVIAVIRRAATLTKGEAQRLRAARDAVWITAGDAVWDAAREAMWDVAWNARWTAREAAREAVWNVTWDAMGDAARGAMWDAVWDTAAVAVVADLAGQYGLTQQHIDLLMKPWIDVVGTDWAEGTSGEGGG